MYGLTNAAIAQKLEAQEGAAACEGYVPVKERKKKSHIPQGDGEEEDDSFEFDSALEASPSEASLASEASAMLEISEEEALEKEALLQVQALSARRRSRSAKADKSKRLSAQSKEAAPAEETVVNAEARDGGEGQLSARALPALRGRVGGGGQPDVGVWRGAEA